MSAAFGRTRPLYLSLPLSFPRVGVVVHVHPDHFARVLPLGRHEVEVGLQLIAARLLLLLLMLVLRRPVRRPVRWPLRVVPVVVGRLLCGPGQRVRAGRPVLVQVRGRRRRAAVHVPAARSSVRHRRRWPVQRPRLRVMVTTAAATAAVLRYQLCGKRYRGRVAQRAGRLFLVPVVLVERVVRVRRTQAAAAAAGRIILPRRIDAAVILRRTHNQDESRYMFCPPINLTVTVTSQHAQGP